MMEIKKKEEGILSMEQSHGVFVTSSMKLTIELVPKACWYSNLREKIPRAAWDKLRKEVYARYKNQCGVCHTNNVILHCHEVWEYDDTRHIQKLADFIALCEMCHHCKHIGLAGVLANKGQLDLEQVKQHFTRVNGCTHEEFAQYEAEAWETWRKRNKFVWTTDLGDYSSLVKHR